MVADSIANVFLKIYIYIPLFLLLVCILKI